MVEGGDLRAGFHGRAGLLGADAGSAAHFVVGLHAFDHAAQQAVLLDDCE